MKRFLLSSTLILMLCASVLMSGLCFGAEPHEILSEKMVIDGEPDDNLEQKATAFEITLNRIGGGIGPYTAYLCYDAENIYFACNATDDEVSCLDEATEDFMDSDYIRFYICVDDDFKGRQALNGKSDWAIIFAPQDTEGNWIPMVKECPYNGPGHGVPTGDDITPNRASSAGEDGWFVEAAIPFSLFETTYEELSELTFGVYFIAGDTDKSGARTGEMSMDGAGQGNYWNSPDFWQESILGEFFAVDNLGKMSATWAWIKAK